MTRTGTGDRHSTERGKLVMAVAFIATSIVLFGFAASAQAAAKFGAKLHSSDGSVIQPNANQSCQRSGTFNERCTRVAVRYTLTGAAGGNVRAPRDGVIRAIKFVAQGGGYIKFELARVRHYKGGDYGRARIVARTDNIHYEDDRTDPHAITTVHVHQKVDKGDYLAIESRHFGMLWCFGPSPQQLLFPALTPGGAFTSNNGRSSECTVLMQAIYANGS